MLSVKQDSKYEGRNWWKWSVWLEGPSEELKIVDHVVYTLHPTFPEPVRRISDRRSGFRLDSAGWGEFDLHLQIVYKDGKVRKRTHSVKLSDGAGSQTELAGESASGSANEGGPVAYISSGSADAGTARRLGELLQAKGVRIVSADEPGVPAQRAIDNAMGAASIAVFVLSSRPSLWANQEIERALSHKVRHIVPIIVGTDTELPPPLHDFQAIHVDSPKDVEPLAERLLATAFDNT
jgi:hypothetical protein